MAVVSGMCASRDQQPHMEFELLSEAPVRASCLRHRPSVVSLSHHVSYGCGDVPRQESPLRALHERMVQEQSVLWIPEYGVDTELHLLAVSVVSPDREWWVDDEPTEIPVLLGYISKRVSPHRTFIPSLLP